MAERVAPADVVRRIGALRAGTTGTVLVAIDGQGGAGKSSLARLIQTAIGDVSVVCLDAFARPTVPGWDWQRFVSEVLTPVVEGRPARYQWWGWVNDEPGGWIDVPAGGVLVVEGVGALRNEIGHPWHLSVWVDTPADLRLQRGVERDGEAMRSTWTDRWMPEEDAYVATQRPQERADFIVEGTAPLH